MFNWPEETKDVVQKYSLESKKVLCGKCHNEAVFIDYGPNVGAGYYCRNCRDEVEHDDNVYGIIARQKRASKRSLGSISYNINCTKSNCSICVGVNRSLPTVIVNPGDWVKCVNSTGVINKLTQGVMYKVICEELTGIRIQVGQEQLSYARCRFAIEVKNANALQAS